ncbi:MAG TPA: hypothetical protein VGL23_15295 [Chloroflexota bacterium]
MRILRSLALTLKKGAAELALAATAAFAYATVAEGVEGRPGGDLAALAAPVALLWPAAYTLGQFSSDFFLGQMFGLACLIGALYWARGRSPLALIGLVALGTGLVFSYPTLLPIFGLGVALARRRWLDLALVGLPVGALAGLYLLARAGTGLDVVRQGGVALAPGPETLPPLFLLAGAAGLAWASRRRERAALAAFAWAALLQTAAFALVYRLTGELSRYAVEKMVYVLVPTAWTPASAWPSPAAATSSSSTRRPEWCPIGPARGPRPASDSTPAARSPGASSGPARSAFRRRAPTGRPGAAATGWRDRSIEPGREARGRPRPRRPTRSRTSRPAARCTCPTARTLGGALHSRGADRRLGEPTDDAGLLPAATPSRSRRPPFLFDAVSLPATWPPGLRPSDQVFGTVPDCTY